MAKKKSIPEITHKNLKPPYHEYGFFIDAAQNPFRPAARGFELVNAWWLAEASTLAYHEPNEAVVLFERAGLKLLKEFNREKTGTECFVVGDERFVVVVFRGTETSPRRSNPRDFGDIFRDLMTDADFVLAPSKKSGAGRVHHGFSRAVEDLWADDARTGAEGLRACLLRLKAEAPSRTLWFTGHSLGAALATLAAFKCGEEAGLAVHGLYTFGSPLVGDAAFARAFRDIFPGKFGVEHYRFVNDKDVVTTVPPHVSGFYTHLGSLKHIDPGGQIRNGPSLLDRLKQGLRSLFSMPFDSLGRVKPEVINFIPEGLEDHVPIFYAVHIWNAYAGEAGRS